MGERKLTLREMRDSGPTRLLIYCGDYHCAHSVVVDADRWSDDVRLSGLEPLLTCKACGHRGADVRQLFEPAPMGAQAHNAETRRVNRRALFFADNPTSRVPLTCG